MNTQNRTTSIPVYVNGKTAGACGQVVSWWRNAFGVVAVARDVLFAQASAASCEVAIAVGRQTTTPEWQAKLREGGYRLTAQRQLVLEAVASLGHATPEDICAQVQATAQAVNISTIYRNLELLEELGLVAHAHLRHGAPTYHATTEEPHVHLVCSRCDAVEPVSTELVEPVVSRLGRERGFAVDVRHVTFSGLCRDCS